MVETPQFILDDYQAKSSERQVKERAHFLFYRMGLGKTPTTVKSLHVVKKPRVLILCPKNAIRVWEDHIKEWFAGLDAKEGITTPFSIWRWRKRQNDPDGRKALWKNFTPGATNIYIMTGAAFLRDLEHLFPFYDVIIWDECKNGRSRKSKIFEALKPYCRQNPYFWPMTGTPGWLPQHTWTLFHLADHRYYSSYWKFAGAFCHVMTNEWGAKEILGIRNEAQWQRTLHSKASVVKQSGQDRARRQLLHIDMDEEQSKIYQQLANEMMAEHEGQIIFSQNTLHRTLQYRQLLVCPKILNSAWGYGAAISDLAETLSERDPQIVIFTPFREAIPHFRTFLGQNGYPNTFELTGGLDPDELVRRIEEWRRVRGQMLVTISSATAYSLEPSTAAFFIGYEFDPEMNLQAEYRLQRKTTKYDTNSYYYSHNDTYDEEVTDIVCIKHQNYEATFKPSPNGLIKI
jgi:hypothetical protein